LKRESQGKEVLKILLGEKCVVIYGEQILALVNPFLAGAGQHLIPESPSAKRRANAQPQECSGPRLVVGRKSQPGHAEYRFNPHINVRVADGYLHAALSKRNRRQTGSGRRPLHGL